jgi:type IV pilus assembly protein PilX
MKRRCPPCCAMPRRRVCSGRQHGISLVVALIMLVAVMMLGISAVQIALQGEKAARNDRDHQIAFQAAEAALADAERDIGHAPDATGTRSTTFSSSKAIGFTEGCGAGDRNPFLGLCLPAAQGSAPVWLTVDFLDTGPSTMKSVPYGKFTGQIFQTGNGSLPGMLPRYIIELMQYNKPGESAGLNGPSYFYRITALGFGMHNTTRVVLQIFYRKEE